MTEDREDPEEARARDVAAAAGDGRPLYGAASPRSRWPRRWPAGWWVMPLVGLLIAAVCVFVVVAVR